MQPEKSSRIDTSELKAQLLKKVGPERFKKYFFCLNRFINQNVSKSEFDKSCYRLLGRENLPLHNQIIRAVLKNVCSAQVPPPQVHEAGPATEAGIAVGKCSQVLEDGHGQDEVLAKNQSSVPPVWANGVVPVSPRKGRSTIRDRKIRDRPSPLGPNGKLDSVLHQSTSANDVGAKAVENGDLAPCDYQRLLQQSRGLAEQPENDERLVIERPTDVSVVVRGKDQNNLAAVEDGGQVGQCSRLKFSGSPLRAPLGIPFGSASTRVARKALPVTYAGEYGSCFDIAGLSDSETLQRRMELIAAAQGLGGVNMESANTLNNMVDVYLKRLIRSCLELVGSRSASDMSTCPVQKQLMHGRHINGLRPSNHLHTQSGGCGGIEEPRFHHSVSLLDFKVAMELNPQQLGEDWPSLLEKISMQAFDE